MGDFEYKAVQKWDEYFKYKLSQKSDFENYGSFDPLENKGVNEVYAYIAILIITVLIFYFQETQFWATLGGMKSQKHIRTEDQAIYLNNMMHNL